MLPFVKNNLLSSALLFFEQSNPGTLSNNSVIYFKIEVSPLLEQSNPGTLSSNSVIYFKIEVSPLLEQANPSTLSNNSVIYFKSKVSPLLVKLVLSVYIFNLWIYQSSPFIEDLATDNFNTSSISRCGHSLHRKNFN